VGPQLEHHHEGREGHEEERSRVGAAEFIYPQMSQMDTDGMGCEGALRKSPPRHQGLQAEERFQVTGHRFQVRMGLRVGADAEDLLSSDGRRWPQIIRVQESGCRAQLSVVGLGCGAALRKSPPRHQGHKDRVQESGYRVQDSGAFGGTQSLWSLNVSLRARGSARCAQPNAEFGLRNADGRGSSVIGWVVRRRLFSRKDAEARRGKEES
jgi:hypothetical protein